MATKARGIYRDKPQRLILIRLQSLNAEVEKIIDVIEPLLAAHGVIPWSGPTTTPRGPSRP
jgi:hypothetical protein